MRQLRSFVWWFAVTISASLVLLVSVASIESQTPAATPATTTPLVTLKSDATTLGAAVSNWTVTGLNTGTTTGLTFSPVLVGAYGSYTQPPPGSPAGTQVVNLPPGPASGTGQSGYFKATFTVPAGATGVTLAGAANVDDFGRVFLNGHALTLAMTCTTTAANCISEGGNGTFSDSTLSDFVLGGTNVLIIADANTNGGPSALAYFATVTPTSGADLTETAVSNPPASASSGASFTVTDTAKNSGTASAAATVTRYYLSSTTNKTASSYLLTGTRSVPALAAAATSSGSVSVTVRSGIPHGTYYLLACANDNVAVAESNYTNNCKASTSEVTVNGPQLEVTAVSSPPANFTTGSVFTVSDTAENIGQVASAASTTRFYLSKTTGKIAGSSYLLTGTRAVPALAVNATSSGSTSVTVPSGVPTAIYYLLACANDTGSSPEANTAANCKASATTTAQHLILPASGSLPAGTTGAPYSAKIVAPGGNGSASGYGWTVNGLGISQAGLSVNIGGGLSATTTDNNTLTIQGTPTTTTGSSPISFTAAVSNNGQTAGPNTYTIAVNAGYAINGNVWQNVCGSIPMPPITIKINTNPARSTTTNSNGQFSFQGIPNGTYALTPSISGPNSLFYPATQTVSINNNSVGAGFQVSLGYTVSGTVSYPGTKTGRIYLGLYSNCGGGGGPAYGTSIATPGTFTIRGVSPGNYSLNAWRDNLGFGQPNSSNPTANLSAVNVTTANLTSEAVPLKDPAAATVTSAPAFNGGGPFNNGAFLGYQPVTDNNGVETPLWYTVQWSTSSTFTTIAGSHSYAATGANGSDVWMLSASNVTGLNPGTAYYFRAQGVAGSSTGPWSAKAGPFTVGAPTAGNTVSGSVSWTGTATGPLYVGYYDQNTGKIYSEQVGSKTSPPTSPAAFTVKVPTGTNYFFFGIIDQNNNGLVDPGDIQNTSGDGTSVSISGNLMNQDLTLPSAASTATVTTQFMQWTNNGSTNNGYNIRFDVQAGVKMPVAVTLISGPNTISPVDMGSCGNNCGQPDFQFNTQQSGAKPKIGDPYTFALTYSDGTTANLTAAVTGVLGTSALATLTSPKGTGIGNTPTFTWNYPATPSNYTYQFWLCCGQNGTIWNIPDNSYGFSYTQITPPLAWGVDPTDPNNKPSPSALSPASPYSWSVATQDSKRNSATSQVNFETAGVGPLSLPSSNPSSLPSAIVNTLYNGTVTATGGAPPYSWTVTGLSDSLGWGTQGNNQNTLNINGTPTQLGNVTFNATVKDSKGTTFGPITYTVAVLNETPIGLPAASSNPLTPGLAGFSYSGALSATGGAGGGNYKFQVNGTAIPTTMTYTAPATGGGGLTFANSGGNTLWVGGTPAAAGTITLTVKVIDTTNLSDTATQTYSVSIGSGPNGANNANLKGQYTCLIQGYKDSSQARIASLATFTADGAGNLKNGVFDTNSRQDSAEISSTLSGTYKIGADNNGIASITSAIPSYGSMTTQWALALSNPAVPAIQMNMIEIDGSSTNEHSIGKCYLANPAAFTSSTINGSSWAIASYGEGNDGTPKASVGRFTGASAPTSSTPGTLTNGYLDMAKGGNTAIESTSFTGTYTAPSSTTGRFTSTLTPATGNPENVVVYLIDANRAFSLSANSADGVTSGEVRKQQQASYSAANLHGGFVWYTEGFEFDGTSTPSGNGASVMQGTGSTSGITINASFDDYDGSYQTGKENGGPISVTYDTAHPGRATFAAGSNGTGYIYLFNNATGFALDINDTDGNFDFGYLDPQTQTTFTDAAIAGSYVMGELPRPVWDDNQNVGEVKLDNLGATTGGITKAGVGTFNWDQALSMPYAWNSVTYGTLLLGDTGKQLSCVVISSTKFVCTEQTSQSGHVMVFGQ